MEYEKIIKYLQGLADDIEKKQLFAWIEESSSNKDEFISIKKAWALTSRANENAQAVWNTKIKTRLESSRKRKLLATYLQRAAILIAMFSLGSLMSYFIVTKNQASEQIYADGFHVEVPLGQTSNVELPDGTIVMLNSGSSISYSSDFSVGKREVEITGEAYFDVQKDKEHPFIVKSPLLDIKVYGTSFNVEAYPEDNTFSTTLIEGSISVLNKNGDELSLLKPGENALMDDSQSNLKISQVDTEMFTSWREGIVTFRNEKLGDIAQKMERWFNVEIQIQNKVLKEESYYITILRNKPIDQVLEVLEITSNLHYEIIPRAGKPTLIYWK